MLMHVFRLDGSWKKQQIAREIIMLVKNLNENVLYSLQLIVWDIYKTEIDTAIWPSQSGEFLNPILKPNFHTPFWK